MYLKKVIKLYKFQCDDCLCLDGMIASKFKDSCLKKNFNKIQKTS